MRKFAPRISVRELLVRSAALRAQLPAWRACALKPCSLRLAEGGRPTARPPPPPPLLQRKEGDTATHVGSDVELRGWVRTVRDQKQFCFMQVRGGGWGGGGGPCRQQVTAVPCVQQSRQVLSRQLLVQCAGR